MRVMIAVLLLWSSVVSGCEFSQLSWPELQQQQCQCQGRECQLRWHYQTPPSASQMMTIVESLYQRSEPGMQWLDEPILKALSLQFTLRCSTELECALQKTDADSDERDRHPAPLATAY